MSEAPAERAPQWLLDALMPSAALTVPTPGIIKRERTDATQRVLRGLAHEMEDDSREEWAAISDHLRALAARLEETP